jgi:hypothetical protein
MEKRATKGFYCREREASPEVKDSVLMGGAEIFFLCVSFFCRERSHRKKVRALSTKKKKVRALSTTKK